MFILIEGMTEDDAKAMDFNTSHVYINLAHFERFAQQLEFQYISCLY